MAHDSDKIQKPVRLQQDLSVVFGMLPQLRNIVTNAVINKWSLAKPFKNNAQAFSSDSERASARIAATFGLSIPVFTTASAFIAGYKTSAWTYDRPTGGTYPCRSLDFDEYRTEAVRIREWSNEGKTGTNYNLIFCGTFVAPRSNFEIMDSETVQLSIDQAKPSAEGRHGLLYPIDFVSPASPAIAGWYLGLAFIGRNGVGYYITNNTTFSDLTGDTATLAAVHIPSDATAFPVNTAFDVVPILARVAQTSMALLQNSGWNNSIVTLNGQWFSMTKRASGTQISVSRGEVYVSGGHAKVDVTINNPTGSAVTINPMFAYIVSQWTYDGPYFTSVEERVNQWESAGTTYSSGISIDGTRYARYANAGSQTVNAGQSKTVTIDFGYASDDLGHTYDSEAFAWVCYQYNGTRFIA